MRANTYEKQDGEIIDEQTPIDAVQFVLDNMDFRGGKKFGIEKRDGAALNKAAGAGRIDIAELLIATELIHRPIREELFSLH